MLLDPSTVLALAIQCSPAPVDPQLVLAIARTESGLHTDAIHVNKDGSVDRGLMQINSKNYGWLGMNDQTALDPCASIRAGVRVLMSLSAYNTGNPTAGINNGYAAKVVGALADIRQGAISTTALPPKAASSHPNSPPAVTLSSQISTLE